MEYNEHGNISKKFFDNGEYMTYKYDDNQKLISLISSDNAFKCIYHRDIDGNVIETIIYKKDDVERKKFKDNNLIFYKKNDKVLVDITPIRTKKSFKIIDNIKDKVILKIKF
jgi:hypothetical protein